MQTKMTVVLVAVAMVIGVVGLVAVSAARRRRHGVWRVSGITAGEGNSEERFVTLQSVCCVENK